MRPWSAADSAGRSHQEDAVAEREPSFRQHTDAPSRAVSRDVRTISRLPDRSNSSAVQQMGMQLEHTILQNIEQRLLDKHPISRSRSFPLPLLAPTISNRRGFDLSLSRLHNLPSPVSTEFCDTVGTSHDSQLIRTSTEPVSSQHLVRSNSQTPLTPPHEIEVLSWAPDTTTVHPGPSDSDTASSSQPGRGTIHPGGSRSVPIRDDASTTRAGYVSSLNFASDVWFRRALGAACAAPDLTFRITSTKVISQVLPPNASDQRSVKTYEMVCDHLQNILPEPRYISITHALTVSPGQVVEDFPKSPPATPSFSGDSYFGDQTVFTHAAQVPVHHELRVPANNGAAPPQRHIMIAEANLVVLERFIPPTTLEETHDFFNANSCRSYLADRLPELASNTGSLLLIYPTGKGAKTFSKHYVGPVLDPLLREMTVLKALNTNAAERLGRMSGTDKMYEFEQMKSKIQDFCISMNSRQATRRSGTEFTLIYSDRPEIVLDRDTWMTWFVEQEQSRMKQDLVEYHRDGGKLPGGERDKNELTAGMLAREIIEGFRKSKNEAGNVGVEIGVFVIRRHRIAI
ncbi:hypothetical protein LTS08_000936 [Lithohypha guttulata]|nr:hypothetical protein LTS08_000936 [Lithohypha guttulata]